LVLPPDGTAAAGKNFATFSCACDARDVISAKQTIIKRAFIKKQGIGFSSKVNRFNQIAGDDYTVYAARIQGATQMLIDHRHTHHHHASKNSNGQELFRVSYHGGKQTNVGQNFTRVHNYFEHRNRYREVAGLFIYISHHNSKIR